MIITVIISLILKICSCSILSNSTALLTKDYIPILDTVGDSQIDCDLPDAPANGKYFIVGLNNEDLQNITVVNGTVLYYACNEGYDAMFTPTAICSEGKWVTGFQECRKNDYCDLPDLPEHGGYSIHGSSAAAITGTKIPDWTVLVYTCDPLHTLIGDNITLCRNSKWSGAPPICARSKLCLLPDYPANGKYIVIGSNDSLNNPAVKEFTILLYSCDETHRMMGGALRACNEGNWLEQAPTCEEYKECITPTIFENGYYTVVGTKLPIASGSYVQEGTTLTFHCLTNFVIFGKEWSTCISRSWTSKMPICIERTKCALPNYPSNGNFNILVNGGLQYMDEDNEQVDESTILIFSCDNSYNLIGTSSIFCHNKTWSEEVPVCIKPEECSSLGEVQSDVYTIEPNPLHPPFSVYCDMTFHDQKWTTIQSRSNGSVDFFRNYDTYVEGFGSPHGEYWLGLENIYQLTKDKKHELIVHLETITGVRYYARYSRFSISEALRGYKLIISGYSGTAGDALKKHNGMSFSTFDKDRDTSHKNCAKIYKSGWWFEDCHRCNLNGMYYTADGDNNHGLVWTDLFTHYPLKTTKMLIRKNPELKHTQ